MTRTAALRPLLRMFGAAIAALLFAAAPAAAQTIAVMVNGDPITDFDIEQRSKLTTLTTRKTPDRKQVLDELIDERVKIKEAKKFGIDPSGADIDQSFAAMGTRMRLSPEQLTQSLAGSGVRAETLKARIRADMVWASLVRGRYKDSLLVGEKDVAAALGSDAATETEAFEYQLRPVVLIVPRGPTAAALSETRKREAEALRARVTSCAEAEAILRVTPNTTLRTTVVKTSADLSLPLRELLDKTPVGHLTTPEVTRQGVEMSVLCARNPTKVDSPKKREIREKMYMEKYEAKSKSYLKDVRGQAMIEYRGASR